MAADSHSRPLIDNWLEHLSCAREHKLGSCDLYENFRRLAGVERANRLQVAAIEEAPAVSLGKQNLTKLGSCARGPANKWPWSGPSATVLRVGLHLAMVTIMVMCLCMPGCWAACTGEQVRDSLSLAHTRLECRNWPSARVLKRSACPKTIRAR